MNALREFNALLIAQRSKLIAFPTSIFVHKMYSYIKFLHLASPNSCRKILNGYDAMNPTNEVR